MQEKFLVSITKEWNKSHDKLPPAVQKRASRAAEKMVGNPWSPELHPEKIQKAEKGMHSARVDDDYRIVWKHIKPNNIVLCFVDKHDAAYSRATRTSFTLKEGVVIIRDILEAEPNPEVPAAEFGMFGTVKRDPEVGKLFVGYRDQELLDFGISEEDLPHVRVIDDLDELGNVERLLPPDVFDHLLSIAIGTAHRPVVPDKVLAKSLERYQGGEDMYRFLDTDEFKRALNNELEDWMLFMAPDQREIISRDYAGPARVKGVVGSGKTAVAVHRLRHLARKAFDAEKTVLFLTYGNRLPAITEHLLKRLAGEKAPELAAVECKTIASWCGSFLKQHGQKLNVRSGDKLERAIDHATDKAKQASPKLKMLYKNRSFFKEEIKYAIKGRAISNLEDYLRLDRIGRGTSLNGEERTAMFKIYQDYQRYLSGQNLSDYDDLYLKSLELVESGNIPTQYIAAVIDEMQDLSAAQMRLVRGIIPEGPNDLFMVGDGLQRIYPGGYVLRQLGIDIVGRGELLKQNYRNTHEIFAAAYAMVEHEPYDDFDGEIDEGISPEISIRHGPKPKLHCATTISDEMKWVSSQIKTLKSEHGYRDKDFCFLYRWRNPYQTTLPQNLNSEVGHLTDVTSEPDTYFGANAKHTTFHSAKGLEFKVVFLLGVTDDNIIRSAQKALPGKERDEKIAEERRILYVAMTRARDLLYLTCSDGQPSRFLEDIPDDLIDKT